MKTTSKILSPIRLQRLRAQGYVCETDHDLTDMAFGIRFPYRLCVAIIVVAMLTKSLPIFAAMLILAFLGVVLPNHPFDYVYNHLLSKPMHKPMVPPRSKQLKFACTIATLWLAAIVYSFTTENITTALVLAGMLAAVAILPSTIDLCIPSLIYNAIFRSKEDQGSR